MDLGKLRIVGQCKDCRWHYQEDYMDHGKCVKLGYLSHSKPHSDAKARLECGDWYESVWMNVDADFGCVSWESPDDNLLERIERLEGTTYAEDD